MGIQCGQNIRECVCTYAYTCLYMCVYICMCIHLHEHQKRPVMQRKPRGILHVEMASEWYPPRASCSGTALMAPLTLSCSLSHQTHITRLVLFDQYSQDTYPSCSARMRVPPLGPSVDLPMGPRNDALGAGEACVVKFTERGT